MAKCTLQDNLQMRTAYWMIKKMTKSKFMSIIEQQVRIISIHYRKKYQTNSDIIFPSSQGVIFLIIGYIINLTGTHS